MKNNMSFCIECGHPVPYSVVSTRIETTVRDVRFSYIELSAYCEKCGEEIYVDEINDANVEAMEEAYRKAACLITNSDIHDIMHSYDIGAGPLAKILGFGEVTITRYLAGQLPSRSHSDILLKIKHDRSAMKLLLESKKNEISSVAYNKCCNALDKLNKLYCNNKIDLVARYFIACAKDITPLALQKLLYYAQAFYFSIYGEMLFEDDCQAWAYGPVFPNVYYRYKDYGYDPSHILISEMESDTLELSVKEVEFLNTIFSSFGCYSGKVLSEMTHSEKPWLEARGNLLPTDRCVTTIKRETINKYFNEISKLHNIINPCDVVNYSKTMYKKINLHADF